MFHDGLWYFRMDDDEGSPRAWMDLDTALADLANQGWKISRQYPKGFGSALRSRLGLFGYLLERIDQ